MDSPVKINWTPLKMFAIGGIVIVALVNLMTIRSSTLELWVRILCSIILFLTFTFLGFSTSITSSAYNIFHIKVKNPVQLSELEVDQTYYLNGETEAVYLGSDEFSHKYYFKIDGLGDQNSATPIHGSLVVLYISKNEEK